MLIVISTLGTLGYGLASMIKTVCVSVQVSTILSCRALNTAKFTDAVKHISAMLIMQFLTGASTASSIVVSYWVYTWTCRSFTYQWMWKRQLDVRNSSY